MCLCTPIYPRPQDWYGPEDWSGFTDPEEDAHERRQQQLLWDSEFSKLPWWRRLWYNLTGI